MKDPRTFVFIKRRNKGTEKFQFPQLDNLFSRLKSKEICKIELENKFISGWGENKPDKSNLLGSVIQKITFKDGEVFERMIQCRLDDSHDDASIHFNFEVSTRSKTMKNKRNKISHKKEIKSDHSSFDLDSLEYTWIGIFYPGRSLVQPMAFPHNEKAEEYLKKQEQLLNNRNISEKEIEKLSSELMRLYKEMNKN